MRGKVIWKRHTLYTRRITPAHAGKRLVFTCAEFFCGDHPRTCGEKSVSRLKLNQSLGSPPHMRGKGTREDDNAFGVGITPAHAGKRLKESLKTAIKLMKKISFHSVCYKLHIKADNPQQLYDSVHPLFQSMKQLYQAYNYPILWQILWQES